MKESFTITVPALNEEAGLVLPWIKYAKRHPHIRVIHNPGTCGNEIMAGLMREMFTSASKADVVITRLGRRIYGKGITARMDPRGEAYYWLAGPIPKGVPEKGTDIRALKSGKVSVTPLRITGTETSLIPKLSRWRLNWRRRPLHARSCVIRIKSTTK